MKPAAVTKKPSLNTDAALKFAAQEAPQATKSSPAGGKPSVEPRAVSGLVPDGDVRLTANIRQDLHLKLKIEAAQRRTTIGEIIEELVERNL